MSVPDAAAPAGLGTDLTRSLEHSVRSAQSRWRAPAVSAGVVREGRLVWSLHVGAARLAGPGHHAVTATDDTQFMIGSITKTLTALTVMSLRDEGRLSLDDTIGDHLPGSRHARVPLRQMLAHASGLQREPVGRLWESLTMPDRETFVGGIEQAEQVLPAHHAFHYSNLAYGILGELVQRLTGSSFADAVHARVTGPLGMARTSLTPEQDRAHGYHVDPFAGTAHPEPVFDTLATAPIGGLWSSVADLARYAAYIAEPDGRVVSADTVSEMVRPIILTDPDRWTGGYGLGFGMARRGDRVFVGHGGAMPGFLAGLRVSRPDRTGVVVLTNTSAGATPTVLAGDLLHAILEAEPAMPRAWQPEQPAEGLEELLGTWWLEGEALHLFVEQGRLWGRLDDEDPLGRTRFVAEGQDRYRADEGRERGELLELVRDEHGGIVRIYFASYAGTRDPRGFADLGE